MTVMLVKPFGDTGLTKTRFPRLLTVTCQLAESPTETFSTCSFEARVTVVWKPAHPSICTTAVGS